MAGQHVLAIDQGTTGTKALVITEDGQVAAGRSQEFRQLYPRPGWVEHDPEEIWRSVTATAEAALHEARVRPGMAGLATGVFADRGELQRARKTAHRYEPRMSQARRDELHGRWREAVDRARRWAREEA